MKYQIYTFVMLFTTLTFAACQTIIESSIEIINGSGNIINIDRTVVGFSSVEIYIGGHITLMQGHSENFTIQTDDNLMPYIQTEVQQEILVISTPEYISLAPSQPVTMTLGFISLNRIDISGNCDVVASDITLDDLTLNIWGEATSTLSGRVDRQTLTVNGSATMHHLELVSEQVTIDIHGTAVIDVFANDMLDVAIAGSGVIRYGGQPTVSQDISGMASISARS